jgi:hypothetical protein
MSILRLPKRNLKLAERIGQRIKNEQLLFLIAVYKRDFQNIVQYFSSFSELRRTSEYLINGIVQDIVDICIENKLENKKIAKSLLRTDFIRNYTTNQVDYLLEQIDDFDHIRWQLNFHGFFSRNIPLLEKLYTMDKGKTKEILQDIGKFFKKLHWTDIVAALVFVKKYYGRDLVEEIIKKNEDIFKTSSTLKSNLKKKRIHVSYTKGEFIVEVQ